MKTEVQMIVIKPITIDDITNKDHIGWQHEDGTKGYASKIAGDTFVALSSDGNEYGDCVDCYTFPIQKSIKNCLNAPSGLKSVFKFDARKELYQWLAE